MLRPQGSFGQRGISVLVGSVSSWDLRQLPLLGMALLWHCPGLGFQPGKCTAWALRARSPLLPRSSRCTACSFSYAEEDLFVRASETAVSSESFLQPAVQAAPYYAGPWTGSCKWLPFREQQLLHSSVFCCLSHRDLQEPSVEVETHIAWSRFCPGCL